jgi:hypothetical protein
MGRVGLWMIGMVAFLALPETAARFQQVQGASDPTTTYSGNSINDPAVLGVGVGWKHDWFRADITGDYPWRS